MWIVPSRLPKTMCSSEVGLLGEQGLKPAVRPQLDQGRGSRVVMLLYPLHRVRAEAPGSRDDQSADDRRLPELDGGQGCGDLWRVHRPSAPVLRLDDDSLVPHPTRAVAQNPIHGDVATAVRCASVHQPLHVLVVGEHS